MAKQQHIEEIDSDANFDKKWDESKLNDQRVCIDFTATWCGPCKAIAPVFLNLAKQHGNIRFWKVDFDKCKEAVQKFSVQAVPTFFVLHWGFLSAQTHRSSSTKTN